ncbi:MAG TPA: acyltransferase family protein [Gallionellaceae bacterium]
MPRTSSTTQEHNFHPVYRPDVDGLRAVAILSVVIFHAFPAVLPGGFVGVDIFFVISGFLISSIIFKSLVRDDFRFLEFYAHRVKRIFPALTLVLVATYALGWFTLLPEEFAQLGKHMAAGAGFVQNFALWNEAGYFDIASELKPLMHLWSLAIEEQFYLVYPLLIWGAWRLRLKVLTVVGLLGVLSFGLNVGGIAQDAVKTFFLPQTRFWELLAGAVLAYLQLFKRLQFTVWLKHWVFHSAFSRQQVPAAQRETALNNWASILGLLLIASAVIGLNRGLLFPGWWALAPVMGGWLLIFAGPDAWGNRKFLSNRLMVFVGLISYPLYLWHWPLLAFARIVESETPSIGMRIAGVALSFLLAWLTYRLVERPIRYGRKHWGKTTALCVLIFLVGFVGYNTFSREGLSFRLNAESQENDPFGWPYSDNEQCREAYPELSRVKGEYCVEAKKNVRPTIIVVGDSHSNHLYPGLAEATSNSKENVLNLGRGGCMPFYDVGAFEKGAIDGCVEYTNRVLLFVERTSSIRTVVMSSRGPIYLTGEGYNEKDVGQRIITLKDRPEVTDYRQIFEMAMRNTIQRLIAKHKQIIFVLDVPELGFDPALCIKSNRPVSFTTKLKTPCAISRQEYNKRNDDYRRTVLSVLKNYPTVKIYDAAAELCDDDKCWAMKEGKMLYRNDDHLSIEGSRYIAKGLVNMLQP